MSVTLVSSPPGDAANSEEADKSRGENDGAEDDGRVVAAAPVTMPRPRGGRDAAEDDARRAQQPVQQPLGQRATLRLARRRRRRRSLCQLLVHCHSGSKLPLFMSLWKPTQSCALPKRFGSAFTIPLACQKAHLV